MWREIYLGPCQFWQVVIFPVCFLCVTLIDHAVVVISLNVALACTSSIITGCQSFSLPTPHSPGGASCLSAMTTCSIWHHMPLPPWPTHRQLNQHSCQLNIPGHVTALLWHHKADMSLPTWPTHRQLNQHCCQIKTPGHVTALLWHQRLTWPFHHDKPI